ncbi:hypothetical protein E2C06_33980 [Dankookia rubra]|uniref:Uncharacterized protein n=1 Tax=Dankookia rubra TaxID=1442381 RepID=A0A4R5Q5K4_9PROT|nr:hypothetical protein [Dankookia rubra]TDH58170.1 hypothetical protein E2C06_33980 [Dankookia rubra]
MRKLLLAAMLACLPPSAMAQRYDSGRRSITAEGLAGPELSGAGVKVNNVVITRSEQPRGAYTFFASAVKRVAGRRSVRIELAGLKGDKRPTISSISAINLGDEQPNRMQLDQHRFIAFPAEVADTRTYLLRVLIP